MNTEIDISRKTMFVYSQEAQEAIRFGRKSHMWFRVVGYGEVPYEPFYQDGWWFEILKSETIIPSEGLIRLDLLRQAGINIKEALIAHEAPKLLEAPAQHARPETREKAVPDKHVDLDIVPALETIVGVLGAVAGAVIALLGIFFVAAIKIDPALIVVLDDGTWLEVMTWYE